jgi:hypothetical protein
MTTPSRRGRFLFASGVLGTTLAAVPALAGSAAPAPLLHAGKGSVVIRWSATNGDLLTGGNNQPFSGTVAGLPVTGTASASVNQQGVSIHWTGKLGKTPFTVAVAIGLSDLKAGDVHVTGTYGKNPMRGTATMSPAHPHLIAFSGSIGSHHVSVTVHQPVRHGNTDVAKASFIES